MSPRTAAMNSFMTGALATAVPDLENLVGARNRGNCRVWAGQSSLGVWPGTPAPSPPAMGRRPQPRRGVVCSFPPEVHPEDGCTSVCADRALGTRRRSAIASRLCDRFACMRCHCSFVRPCAQRDALLRGAAICEGVTSGGSERPSGTSVCVFRLCHLRRERDSRRRRCIFSHRRCSGLAVAWPRCLDWQFAPSLDLWRLNIHDCQS